MLRNISSEKYSGAAGTIQRTKAKALVGRVGYCLDCIITLEFSQPATRNGLLCERGKCTKLKFDMWSLTSSSVKLSRNRGVAVMERCRFNRLSQTKSHLFLIQISPKDTKREVQTHTKCSTASIYFLVLI